MRERQKAQSEADQLVKRVIFFHSYTISIHSHFVTRFLHWPIILWQARQMQVIKEIVGSKNNQSYNMLSEEDRQKLAFLNNSYYTDASPR